jgi:hypothetical protein
MKSIESTSVSKENIARNPANAVVPATAHQPGGPRRRERDAVLR